MRVKRRTLMAGFPAAVLAGVGCESDPIPPKPQWCPQPPQSLDGPATAPELDLESPVTASTLTVSTDGGLVAALHGYQILLWDGHAGGNPIKRFGEIYATRGPFHLAATPDFSHLLTANYHTGMPHLVDVETGEGRDLPHTIQSERDGLRAHTISPDGKLAAFCDVSGNVEIYSFDEDQLVAGFGACGRTPNQPRFSPDSHYLAISSTATEGAQIWDTNDVRKVATITDENHALEACTWSPDGTKLAFMSRVVMESFLWRLTIVDPETWEVADTWELPQMEGIVYPNNDDLWVLEAHGVFSSGSSVEALTEHPTACYAAAIRSAADGKLAFNAGPEEVASINLETEEIVTCNVPPFECSDMEHPSAYKECQ